MPAFLDPAQSELYTHRATFYRVSTGEMISGEDGVRDPVHEQIAVYSDVPCYRRSTRDLTNVTPAGRGTQDNMDTADELHLPMQMEDGTSIVIMGNMRVLITDSANADSNPDDGQWFLTTGQGNPKPWRAKKQIVLIRYDMARKTISG